MTFVCPNLLLLVGSDLKQYYPNTVWYTFQTSVSEDPEQ